MKLDFVHSNEKTNQNSTMAMKTLIFTGLLAICLAQDVPGTTLGPVNPPPPSPAPPAPKPPMPKMPCSTPGFMCSDCDNQAICIGNGEELIQIENKCPEGTQCVGNVCVKDGRCNYGVFKCSDEGFYPDPWDCEQYHVCVRNGPGFQQMDMVCPIGSYDAAAGSCGFAKNSTACMEGPVPRCLEPLQVGALTSDPSMYYICREDEVGNNVPSMMRCGGGMIFDPKKMSCVPAKKVKK